MEPLSGSTGKENQNLLFPNLHHSKASKSGDRSLLYSTDSGYVSSQNVTPYNTPNASSNSIVSTPQRFGNSNLITIPEISDSAKLTPVTQNIRKISDFHITTPKSQDFSAVGSKRSALHFDEYQSTPKKLKLEHSTEELPLKNVDNTPRRSKKSHIRKKSFRNKLTSAPDFDTEFDAENFFSPKKYDLSPIRAKSYSREKRTPLSHANLNLQASTPKSCGYRPKLTATDVSGKWHSVKKLLSFSDKPSESLLDSEVKPTTSICEEEEEVKKTSPKQDDFASKSEGLSLTETPVRSSSPEKISEEYSLQEYKKFYPVFSVLKDREIAKRKVAASRQAELDSLKSPKLAEKIPTTKSEHQTNSKIVGFQDILNIAPSSIDMEISPLKSGLLKDFAEREPDSDLANRNYTLKVDDDIRVDRSIECEPLKSRRQSLELIEQRSNEIGKFSRIPRSPKKQKLHCIEQERAEILYPIIPQTPSKKQTIFKILHNKRLEKRPRKFYNGITYLNIIAKLEPYSLVVEKIFEMLSSQDLLNLIHTSKTYRRIVRSNSRANERLKSYLEACNLSKENNGECKVYSAPKSSVRMKPIKGTETLARMPFAQSNKIDRKRSLIALHSPPVSPSKRKFHENQKVVRTLQENEKLTKCPRCSKSSRIIENPVSCSQDQNTQDNETFHSANSTLFSIRKDSFTAADNNNATVSLPQPMFNVPTATVLEKKLVKSTSLDFGNRPSVIYSHKRRMSSPFRPYGECTGLACRFRFCLDCLCDYHPGSRCRLSEPISPTKEDLQNGTLQLSSSVSRTLKSRRKSLKRLCF